MVCQACGGVVGGEVRFCPRCGAAVAAMAPGAGFPVPSPYGYVAPRVRQHVQTLGYLWCAYGALRFVTGILGLAFVHTIFSHHGFFNHGFGDEGWPFRFPLLGALAPVIVSLTLFRTALSIFTGYALLTRKPFGRTLAIVVAILTLIRPLMGTALGIYTLWVLAPESSGVEYDSMAVRA